MLEKEIGEDEPTIEQDADVKVEKVIIDKKPKHFLKKG